MGSPTVDAQRLGEASILTGPNAQMGFSQSWCILLKFTPTRILVPKCSFPKVGVFYLHSLQEDYSTQMVFFPQKVYLLEVPCKRIVVTKWGLPKVGVFK